MPNKQNCFAISSFIQLKELLEIRKIKNKKTIIFIKYHLINGLGIDWLLCLINLIKIEYKKHLVEYYVDSGKDFGLCIMLARARVNYIKLKSNDVIMIKVNQICNKNKVLINPKINIVDLTNIKFLKRVISKIN